MPDNLPYELGIQVTPTVISADNERHILILDELGRINQKTTDRIFIEQRYGNE
ncbi:hypothetical protein SAMN02910344_02249 [Ruminobacter amylophilus]|uniref:Uncharacterized protein n=2 Tax=Ruminobacter amylophilus TaxID=867 RepID=A0A662ZKY5_9GAMM|nr:hypothetical protein SAMN02910344_02249 [Ruminobacter amylophilus]